MARERFNEQLAEFLIDDALARSKGLKHLNEQILIAQEKLRYHLRNDDAWRAYLDVEALTNKRAAKQLRLLFTRMLAVHANEALPPRTSRNG